MDTVQVPLFSKKTKSHSPSLPGHAIDKNAAAHRPGVNPSSTAAVEAASAKEGNTCQINTDAKDLTV
ncbi:hypothetical protein H0H92_014309, partial [Tricholoma furcatifolium]